MTSSPGSSRVRNATARAPNAPDVIAMSAGSKGSPRHFRSSVATTSVAFGSENL